jgi:hypothetical protein
MFRQGFKSLRVWKTMLPVSASVVKRSHDCVFFCLVGKRKCRGEGGNNDQGDTLGLVTDSFAHWSYLLPANTFIAHVIIAFV